MHESTERRRDPSGSGRLETAVSLVSALGRGVSTLLADMERELEIMAAGLLEPVEPRWRAHRSEVNRMPRPGLRPPPPPMRRR